MYSDCEMSCVVMVEALGNGGLVVYLLVVFLGGVWSGMFMLVAW